MIVLRPATADDAPDLARIMGDWIDQTPWRPRLHSRDGDLRHLARVIGEMQVTVAHEGEAPLGFLALEGDEVDKLYVDGPARGRGLGKLLLDHAKGQVARLGLWTFQANTGARRFYAREGFCEVRLTDGAGNEEKLPDAWLAWERTEA